MYVNFEMGRSMFMLIVGPDFLPKVTRTIWGVSDDIGSFAGALGC